MEIKIFEDLGFTFLYLKTFVHTSISWLNKNNLSIFWIITSTVETYEQNHREFILYKYITIL